jgi:hypothetical protein
MNQQLVDSIVHAVLYHGRPLSPFGARAERSERRPRYGRLFPDGSRAAADGSEPSTMITECLVDGFPTARLELVLRFQQVVPAHVGELAASMRRLPAANNPDYFHFVAGLVVDGVRHATGEEIIERRIDVPAVTLRELLDETRRIPFSFAATHKIEPIRDQHGWIVGVRVRESEALSGEIELSAEPVDAAVTKISARVRNRTPLGTALADDRDEIALRTFASTHLMLHVTGGAFLSMIEPQDAYAGAAALCTNLGVWPVLVGDPRLRPRDTLLASPIILCDYPQAPTLGTTRLTDDEVDGLLALHLHRGQPLSERDSSRLAERKTELCTADAGQPEDAA